MNHNSVTLAGNLTRDPELRFTPSGLAIAKFGLAINRKWKDGQGAAKEETTFINIDSFGKTAELIGQYFKKGNRIFLTGRLKLDSWEDKQSGAKRSKLGVVLETFQFVDRAADKSDPTPDAPPVRRAPSEPAATPPSDATDSDTVPF